MNFSFIFVALGDFFFVSFMNFAFFFSSPFLAIGKRDKRCGNIDKLVKGGVCVPLLFIFCNYAVVVIIFFSKMRMSLRLTF